MNEETQTAPKGGLSLLTRRRRPLAVIVMAFLGLLLTRQAFEGPSLEPYEGLYLEPAALKPDAMAATFLGVSTLLVTDGETSILLDGFFSRPGLLQTAFWPVGPNQELIADSLKRARISTLDAVITCHSHYDHAMDSPEVAKQTGALLVGSPSTAWIARGQQLPEEQIRTVEGDTELSFGEFRVRMIPSAHIDHGRAMGELTEPLVPPVHALSYLEGGSFSIRIEHKGRSVLVQGSAGFVEGALAKVDADVVLLGMGLLGSQTLAYQDAYWREIVGASAARRVIPIHWDNFTLPLDEPLKAIPSFLDDLSSSMERLMKNAQANGVDVRMLPVWERVDLFAGLEPSPAKEPL